MLPKGWKLTTLGEVCHGELKTGPFGSQLHANEYVTNEDGIPVLMPKDLIDYRANLNTAAKITIERSNSLEKHKLKLGDLLFSRRGDVARFALIDHLSEGSICGTGCLKARPSINNSSLFMSYFLQKSAIVQWLQSNSVGQTMPNLNTSILFELPLISPPLPEQIKIAEILSTWDNAINTVQKLLTNSQQQKKALMQQLLTGKKRFAGFEGEWDNKKLESVLYEESSRNKDLSISRVLSITNHSGFVLPQDQFSKRVASDDVSNYKVVKKGQFGYNPSRLNVGSFARLNDYDLGVLSPMYVVFSLKEDKLCSDYFLFWMQSNEARQRVLSGIQGSVRASVGFDDFAKISFKLPSLAEQQKIASALTTVDQEIDNLRAQLNHLKQEKKALMQQLLTGKRRVKVEEVA